MPDGSCLLIMALGDCMEADRGRVPNKRWMTLGNIRRSQRQQGYASRTRLTRELADFKPTCGRSFRAFSPACVHGAPVSVIFGCSRLPSRTPP